jgi:pimeloyl-ACP methyl ester carboxylesterase
MSVPDASVVHIAGPWTHRAVAANGARFHVAELGEGPLVLLLHGFPEFWWAWRHQIVALAAAGYRAVAMDLRGYGASDKPPRGYDPFTLSGDIAAVIKSLGERDAVVAGHDWGAYVGWSLGVSHPGVLRGLVALSMPHPRRLRRTLIMERRQIEAASLILALQLPWLPERRLVDDDGEYVGRLLHAWSAPGWPDEETVARYREAVQIPGVAHCAAEYFRWTMRSLPRPDGVRFAHRMRRPIAAPVLHLHGRLDPWILPASAQGSGQYVEGTYHWRLFDDAGHFPHEEVPDAVTTELLGFLNSLPNDPLANGSTRRWSAGRPRPAPKAPSPDRLG